MKKYGLLGVVLLVLLATPVMAQPTLNKGPISIPSMQIDMLKLSSDTVTYGDKITLSAEWKYLSQETYGNRKIAIVSWSDYQGINVSGTLDIAKLADKKKWGETLPENGGTASWDINTADKEIYPGYYVVVAYLNSTTFNDSLVFKVEGVVAGKPYVSISVTPTTVALGDRIKLSYKMTSDTAVNVTLLLTGWEGKVYYIDCANKTWSLAPKVYLGRTIFDKDTCGVEYFSLNETFGFTKTTTGTMVAKIIAGKGDVSSLLYGTGTDPTRADKVALFTVVKPEILSVSVPSKHVNGTDLTVSGSVNVAESGSDYDDSKDGGVINTVLVNITDINDNPVAAYFPVTVYISKDKTFSVKFENFGRIPALSTGYYKVKFKLQTTTTFTDEEVAVFELVKGMVRITADKTTVTRGDKVKFTIFTNLKVNSPVYFTIEDIRIRDGPSAAGGCETTLLVDVGGNAYYELPVHSEAPLTEYRFKARIIGDVSDELTISVVKQTLDINADKTTVARGGEIRFTGTTTADWVYVYASEANVFTLSNVGIAEVPSDTRFNPGTYAGKVAPDTNDRLDFKLEVNTLADPGTYYLYFYAPSNASQIDRSSDPQKMFAIVVTDPRIVSVEVPSIIPYQGKVEITILTDPGKRTRATVDWKLEGSNIKARPSDFMLTFPRQPDSDNKVKFTLNLADYKGGTKVVDPGLYVFTVKLYLDNDEVDKVQKVVEISAARLDVTIEPETIVVGDKITVKISTSREGIAGYDHIWVTLVGANYKTPQRVTLNSKGEGSATFETLGMADGSYKFYIRDTMGTIRQITESELAENLYDLDPADSSARLYDAHDDLLVIRTIQLLKERPTPTPTPPPTTPPTTPPPTTPPTTPPPTTPPTTPPPTTPPPTTTPKPPIPGFEAIFAIAGLVAIAYLLRRRQ